MRTSAAGHIRWMVRRDMPEVLDIERLCFGDPWTEEEFVRVLRNRNCIGMVFHAESDEVAGFVIYELFKDRLDILNFAVHPFCQRRGVGAAMLGKLVSKLSPTRHTRLYADVRETNLDALAFFRACGFKAVAILRGRFDGCNEDACRLRFDVNVSVQRKATESAT